MLNFETLVVGNLIRLIKKESEEEHPLPLGTVMKIIQVSPPHGKQTEWYIKAKHIEGDQIAIFTGQDGASYAEVIP